MNYKIHTLKVTQGNLMIDMKVDSNHIVQEEDKFKEACANLLIQESDLTAQLFISPCKVLTREQQKLVKYQYYYDSHGNGDYTCKHCNKKYTTTRGLINHLDVLAEQNVSTPSEHGNLFSEGDCEPEDN